MPIEEHFQRSLLVPWGGSHLPVVQFLLGVQLLLDTRVDILCGFHHACLPLLLFFVFLLFSVICKF